MRSDDEIYSPKAALFNVDSVVFALKEPVSFVQFFLKRRPALINHVSASIGNNYGGLRGGGDDFYQLGWGREDRSASA